MKIIKTNEMLIEFAHLELDEPKPNPIPPTPVPIPKPQPKPPVKKDEAIVKSVAFKKDPTK
ncbi:hypothetical protein [Ureaplasma urealyticum]|uniref:Uncharacterized protein n=3 Tax=Ureaplasma urealyticum TaxID=2130 RepID=A0AAP9D780_UREUR|nr:hypothetical protein [Ureaplasma urealyticum]EDX54153.1 hypothetical protein UUR9_0247 [Ureaplasma urealyticum serovar 9 str. ATCC 33175]ACI59991.1 hypothetical protein UUR10_0095 [Ureaplasma urealyticum serovar 10 str. ATCC 33699]EDU06458.1 hypothetical protein UUR5_G0120 [Ureaplasma urealyticum serovar 5 str. ATCC 27817]EDU56704.1 hypothetical protein UUR7_0092 [Ureaplasma urealyticum serovar 7 str. ATCC 27819]EDU66793.1 hypothetical protein UUR11_0091 [Ureaplasma urealyticum serovar 11 s